MALHGCLKGLKYLVFLLNFVIWLAGMMVLGIALYALVDPYTNDFVQAGYPAETHSYHILCYILIVAGSLLTFVGYLGCCGAFQESKCMMGTFSGFGVVILALEISGVVWGLSQQAKIKENVTESMHSFILNNYAVNDPVNNRPIDYVQNKLQCCGALGQTDWYNSTWYQSQPTHSTADIFPKSCCHYTDRRTQGFYDLDVCLFHATGNTAQPWPKGCGELLADLYEEKWLILCWMVLGLTATQLFCTCLSLALFCGMLRLTGGGYKA